MELIDFKSASCKDCCDSKTRVEACSNGNPVIIYLDESTGVPVVSYILLSTGVVTNTAPANLLIGNCTDIANSASTSEVIQGSGSPVVGSVAPLNSKLYYDTVTQSITRANVSGLWVALDEGKLNVLTTIQPTPLATGNTTNLNTSFKDESGNTWIVDYNGDAVQAGSPITFASNATATTGTNTTEAMSPATTKLVVDANKLNVITTIQPTPTATGNTTNLNSTFKDAAGTTWIVDSNGDAVAAGSVVTLDGNNYNVVATNTTAGVAPTALEVVLPINGDTATKFLTDNKIEYWVHNGTTWSLIKTVNPTTLDGNSTHITSIDVIAAVAPTGLQVSAPMLGDTAIKFLTNGNTEYWSYNGTAWVLDKTITKSIQLDRYVQALPAGNTVLTHVNITNAPVMVTVLNATTGAAITHRVIAETATTTTINVTNAVASARITLIG
jgi:hypothetical protein